MRRASLAALAFAPLLAFAQPANELSVIADIEGAPMLGKRDAPVTIVEYTDLECPFCKQFHLATFPELKRKYIDTGKVRYVHRDFPLPSHPRALPAARMARCAGEQDRFWETRHALFVQGIPMDDIALAEIAIAQGLEAKRLAMCFGARKVDAGIAKDAEDGRFLGVGGTPAFVIGRSRGDTVDGVLLGGAWPLNVFEKRIDALLAPR